MPRHYKPNAIGEKNRKRILEFIDSFYEQYGIPPSYREIANAVKISLSSVHYHVTVLEAKGKIEKPLGSFISRAIFVTRQPQKRSSENGPSTEKPD